MILLVFSDNHRDVPSIDRILARHPDADRRISLGDSEMSVTALTIRDVFGVRGNYPFEPDFPTELIFDFEGHRTLIVHGHLFYVKTGLYNLRNYAHNIDCRLVLFGHTHEQMMEETEGIIFVNPGSTIHPKGAKPPSYALITMTPERIRAEILAVSSGEPLQTKEFIVTP